MSEEDGVPVALRVHASAESGPATAASSPPERGPVDGGGTEVIGAATGNESSPMTTTRGPADTIGDEPAAAVETADATREGRSAPLGSDAWSPILDGPTSARRVAERKPDLEDLEDLLG
ncbi:MAG: hypothetical protein WD766_12990 [Gemmatimonadota bacterium]